MDQGESTGQVLTDLAFPREARQSYGSPSALWVGNQLLERQVVFPLPHPIYNLLQKTERKAFIHPSTERISDKTWIKGICDEICCTMENHKI